MQATSNHGGVQPQDQQDDGDMRAQFVQTLLSRRSEAIAGRAGSGIEEEWTEDEEHYQGIDDANRAYQNANQLFRGRKAAMIGTAPSNSGPTRSVVFLNITRPYTDAASARALMLAQASVIKRPVVQWSADTADISVGFDPEAWSQRI